MRPIILFIVLSIPILVVSRKSLLFPKRHGFYRFLSWEAIIFLFVFNYPFWFKDPFSLAQLFSWILLCISLYLVISGVITLKRYGKSGSDREDTALYSFEKTGRVVDRGIYRYIRHPLYSSLLFLSWGVYLKNPDLFLLIPAILSSIFLWITSLLDERECIRFFGEEYRRYMRSTRRFIPYVVSVLFAI